MNRAILLIAICAFKISTYAQDKPKIKGDKYVVTVTNKIISGFNAIEVDDNIDLKITQGIENSYTLNADLNLHDIFQFSSQDSLLKIYTTHKITSSKKLEILLNYINIDQITLKNDAEIETENALECEKMELTAYHSCKFDLDINTKNLKVNLHNNARGKLSVRTNETSITMKDKTNLEASISTNETTITLKEHAQLKLSGDSSKSTFKLKDKSRLDAIDIKTTNADLSVIDYAKAYIYASKNLTLFAKDNTSVYLYGQPSITIKGFSDKTELIKK